MLIENWKLVWLPDMQPEDAEDCASLIEAGEELLSSRAFWERRKLIDPGNEVGFNRILLPFRKPRPILPLEESPNALSGKRARSNMLLVFLLGILRAGPRFRPKVNEHPVR
jgi:hypothetical protein